MKKNQRLLKRIFTVFLIFSLCLSGCGKKDESSSSSSRTTTESRETTEEYNYDEFVNDTEVDLSELEEPDISEEEAKKIVDSTTTVDSEIVKFENSYKRDNEITQDNLYGYLYDLKEYLEEKEIDGVDYYYLHSNYLGIYYKLDVGEYIYTPEMEGYDAGGSAGVMNIATFQPFKSDYNSDLSSLMSYPDDAADMIVSEFPMYKFDNRGTSDDRNYDDEEVTLSSILNFGQNNVIIWHGHGGYYDDHGCTLLTNIPATVENIEKYCNELRDGTLACSNGLNSYFVITPAFFEKYLPDNALANSIIYLGACESGADSSLINVMLDKGAMAVFANDRVIQTAYNLSMIRSVAEGMTKKNGEQYYTLDEALEYAKQENESLNATDAIVYVTYGSGYQNLSMDWYEDYRNCERDVVLVLDNSGSMDGYPLTETKEAAEGFVDTVFEQDSRVGLVSYESAAYVDNWLTTNSSQLKQSIEDLYASGGTNMYAGLESAAAMLERSKAKNKIIVLMSDGMPNEGEYDYEGGYNTPLINYAEELKNKGYLIYTLGFFSEIDSYEKSTAQDLMESIASPGMHYEIDSADNIVYFFDDVASQISGTQYVYIRIACPVEVTVSYNGEKLSSEPDSENTRTSFGTLSYEYTTAENNTDYNEYGYDDNNSSGYSDERVKILRLNMNQDYDINIRGTDRGTMNYTVSYPDSNGEYTDVRDFPNIRVTSSMKATSNTEKEDSSKLEVDEDGDGRNDVTYETESNGTMKEKKNHTVLFICIGVGVAVVLIIVIIIIVAVNNSKKRRPKYPGQGAMPYGAYPPASYPPTPYQPTPYQQTPYTPAPAPIINPSAQGMIIGLFGTFSGQSVPMMINSMCSIGRDHTCNLRIMHKSISRMHCTIQLLPNGMYQITDYSSNGTYYNNQRLIYGQPYMIPKGSIIALGGADNVIQLM